MSAFAFSSKYHAIEWALAQPEGQGRLYVVIFRDCTKIGRTKHPADRLVQLEHDSMCQGSIIQTIVFGPASDEYKALESAIHRSMVTMRVSHDERVFSGTPKEWYRRNSVVEAAVIRWMQEDYSPAYLAAIETAVSRAVHNYTGNLAPVLPAIELAATRQPAQPSLS